MKDLKELYQEVQTELTGQQIFSHESIAIEAMKRTQKQMFDYLYSEAEKTSELTVFASIPC